MPRRILIVDDNTIIRRSIRECIEENTDWEVCGEAENGRLAIEQVQQLQPDLVILDWQMPVMNGLEAAREIHRIAPSTTHADADSARFRISSAGSSGRRDPRGFVENGSGLR